MNAVDYVEGGLNIEDAVENALALEKMGVNALSITSGTMCESVPFCLYPTGTPKSNLLPMAARIRTAVGLPVIVAGRIRTPAVAREALAAGQTDLIGLGRPFLADPDWVRKTKSGDEEAILLCAACHQGCLAQLRKGAGTSCIFNPRTGREGEVAVAPSAHPRQVMVVGGGPAGLEAATVAAQRGHHVTLYERERRLGGQFNLAAKAPHKEEFVDVIRYLGLMAMRAGVDIRLDTWVTPDMVVTTRPDAVILATGGIPLTIPFPGLEDTHWLQASDLLDGGAEVETSTAFVIGGGLVGLETADFLAARGVQVTLVEMLDQVGGDMDPLAKAMISKRLNGYGVKIHTSAKVLRLTERNAVVKQAKKEFSFPIETVVIAVGVRSDRALPDALDGSGLEVHVIGDAVEPRRALEAIREGFEVGDRV
jgi:NADPH-dependent 2,4-dienoyl-CoA reductase/sulfur reductase-like enzyme